MKVYVNWREFEIDVEKIKRISFHYNSKTHRYEIYLNGSEVRFFDAEKFEISKKKGEAIIDFLKWLSQKLSTPGSEENFEGAAISKKSSIAGPGDEETFDMVHDEDIFESAASSKELSTVGPALEETFDKAASSKGTSTPGIEDIFAEDHSEDSFDFQGRGCGDGL